MSHNQRFGRFGEDVAAEHYRCAGADIIERNWRCRRGEIDLIVVDRSGSVPAVVFVEVKARTTSRYGTGLEAVDVRKQNRLRSLASIWLAEAKPDQLGWCEIRFDVVDVAADGSIQVVEGGF